MTKSRPVRRLRIPVRYVDGIWESALGGIVPVKPDANAELLIERTSIADKAFLKTMESKGQHKVLEEGASLLVSLTVKPEGQVPDTLRPHLMSYGSVQGQIATLLLDTWSPETLFFVEVKLAGPDEKQARRFGTKRGGLWLITQGVQAIGLSSTTVLLPEKISSKPVASLNHAFTKLSETYETWRISHTGNVYTRILYQERNGLWYPLELLRNAALDKQELEIAGHLWKEFMSKVTAPPKPSSRN